MILRLHRMLAAVACATFAGLLPTACELAFPTDAESISADSGSEDAAADALGDEHDAEASCGVQPDAGASVSPVNLLTVTGGSDGGGTSSQLNVTTGDLLLVEAHWGGGGSVGVSDTLGNKWMPATMHQDMACGSNGQFDQFWYVVGSKGGPDIVSVAFPPGEGGAFGFFVLEYSGIGQTGAFDSESGQIGGGNAAMMSAGMLSTTCGRDLIVAVFDWWGTGTFTAGSGFTREAVWKGYTAIEDDVPVGASPGQYSPTGALSPASTCWIGASIAFHVR